MEILEKTYKYLSLGGPIMIPIILTSLFMWILIIERLTYFRQKDDIALDQILKGNFPYVSKGVRSRVVTSFLKECTGRKEIDRNILEQCVMREKPAIRRHLTTISILAAIAPLLGLLGTVMGMITTFNVIAIFGTGNAKAMANGISEALITTQSGLTVAIPGLFMSNFLNRQANRLENGLDRMVMELKRRIK